MWHTCCHLLPFAGLRNVLNVSAKISCGDGISKDEINLINSHLDAVCWNKPSLKKTRISPTNVVFAFSDASLSYTSFFICDVNGNIMFSKGAVRALNVDIYELESEEAVEAILTGLNYGDFVILGCDNMDTVKSFQRRHSIRDTVCERILRLVPFFDRFKITHVTSEENPADGLTRKDKGLKIETSKLLFAIEKVKFSL